SLVEVSQQTLRIRPADPNNSPSFFIPLSALETTRGLVTTSPVPVLRRVRYQAWVWDEGDPTSAVPGRVEFRAKSLRDVTETQFPIIQFARTVPIGDDGFVEVELPVGTYDVLVRPE